MRPSSRAGRRCYGCGRVAAVVPVNPWWMGPPTFSTILPERLLREGANSIKGYWTS